MNRHKCLKALTTPNELRVYASDFTGVQLMKCTSLKALGKLTGKISLFYTLAAACFGSGTHVYESSYENEQIDRTIYVNPIRGNDDGAGTQTNPFRTLPRAQMAVRGIVAEMQGHIIVNLASGEYRLAQPLRLTEQDAGRNGFKVIFRSQDGPGQVRILGSAPLTDWQEYRNGIWKHKLSEKIAAHFARRNTDFSDTIYENGKRAREARFPNYAYRQEQPVALGPYLLSHSGSPPPREGDTMSWIIYHPNDAPPVTDIKEMQIHIFEGGHRDWFRRKWPVISIEPDKRRITYKGVYRSGAGARARYFLSNELNFLDSPGEVHVDEEARVLYYKPRGAEHPDSLGINVPLLGRLVELRGRSPAQPVKDIVLDGLVLEEADDAPSASNWWETQSGLTDGALIWMTNSQDIMICNCHLRNSGRHGIMMAGHNIYNSVKNSLIEHMGVNGITLSNRMNTGTDARNERNCIYNCRVGFVGELACYAANINVFNASYNEISFCELHDSVRYAITVRGNTGPQRQRVAWTDQPPARGNHFHHIRIYRSGQDSGDMGAIHTANLNNPGGEVTNTFEQVTIADTIAAPGLQDCAPDGIFLDWPERSMHQVFRNIHVVRSEGLDFRSNGLANAESAQKENVSWEPGFQRKAMQYKLIGLTQEFPEEYGGRSARHEPVRAPENLMGNPIAHDVVELTWDEPADGREGPVIYTVFRDGNCIGKTSSLTFTDRCLLEELTEYSYCVAARNSEFVQLSQTSNECRVKTPADLVPPSVTGAYTFPNDLTRIRVTFNEPISEKTAESTTHYKLRPPLNITRAEALTPDCVELTVQSRDKKLAHELSAVGIRDEAKANNLIVAARTTVRESRVLASYSLERLFKDRLWDASGGGDARCHGGVTVARNAGPWCNPAIVYYGSGYIRGPADLNLGDNDFAVTFWYYRKGDDGVLISKGSGSEHAPQWSIWEPHNFGGLMFEINGIKLETSPYDTQKGKWVHWAFVRKGDIFQAYADGKPSGRRHNIAFIGSFFNNDPLLIGCRRQDEDPRVFKGKLADIKLLQYAPECYRPAAIKYRFISPSGSVNNANNWDPAGGPGFGLTGIGAGTSQLLWTGVGSQSHLAGVPLVLNDFATAVNTREYHLEISGAWTFNDSSSFKANNVRFFRGSEFHWHSTGTWVPVSNVPANRKNPMFSMKDNSNSDFRASMSAGLWDLTGHAGSEAFRMEAGTFDMTGGRIVANKLFRLGSANVPTGMLFNFGGDAEMRADSFALYGDSILNIQGTDSVLYIAGDMWERYIRNKAGSGQIRVDGVEQSSDTSLLTFDSVRLGPKKYTRIKVINSY